MAGERLPNRAAATGRDRHYEYLSYST